MNRNHLLYVENISPSSSEQHLIAYLEKWAPVLQVYFLREKQCTKRSIAAFVRVGSDADLDMLMTRNQQNYRGKRLFMVRVDQTPFFQADHSVIVRNITSKISEENLYEHFEDCGKIAFLQIRTDDFAYIGFEEKPSVRNAMNKNNLPLKGSNLKIQLLTRNIEIMIVNLDTLASRMPDLYKKMILPIEPRQPSMAQQQSEPTQQQKSQPVKQQQQQQQPQKSVGNQQFGNQQQQSQQPRQQQSQPQYQNQQQTNQRQQQPQNQRQQQQQQWNQPQQQPQNQRQQQQPQNQRQQQQQPPNQRQQQQQPQNQRQQQQQPQNQRQQQQPQNQRQQQQQQQNQRQQQQQQNQRVQSQQQPLSQRQQQQPLPQRQQMSTTQLLKEKANTLAEKQQSQQQTKPPQAANAAQPVQEKSAAASVLEDDDNDDVQIIEPTESSEIGVESDPDLQIIDTSMVPPIPSAYKPKPDDLMRPIKASEISLNNTESKTQKNNRSVWVNNIQPETRRLDLVLYMEQFGPVELCKIGSSNNCYFTRWAKIIFTTDEGAKRATEYFLHPFQGRYLFVLSCNKCIDPTPEKTFLIDYLSKYLVYEDVAESFKHVGDVFYLVRTKDNSYKVRIFFLNDVDVDAVLAVKSISGIPVNVHRYNGADLTLSKEELSKFQREREIVDPKKKARMDKILEIYKAEMLNRCDPVAIPDGKSESNVVLMTNVHRSTSDQQIIEYFQSVGKPIFIRHEVDEHNVDCERIFVGFYTLSLVIKATEMATNTDTLLNGYKPFVFVAWTKPHMTEQNTVRLLLDCNNFTIQDVYDQLIKFGKIRYIERENPSSVLVVFDGHDDGWKNSAYIMPGLCIGKAVISSKEPMQGKRSHQSAFGDSQNGQPAKANLKATSGSNTHPETEPDNTLNEPISLDDSNSGEQQPATGDIQHSNSNVGRDEAARDLKGFTFITGTWNVSGCTQASERAHVDSFLSTNGVIVAGLQDTRMSTGTMSTSNYHWFNVNRIAGSSRTDGGAALVVRRDLLNDCNFRQISDDICSVRLPVFGKMLTVVNVYARFLNDPDPSIEALHNFLSGLRTRQRANVVVLGDFKAHIGIQDLIPGDRSAIGKFLFHPWSNTNGVGIQNILRCHNLRLSSSFGPCSSVMCTSSQDGEKSQTSHIMMPFVDRFLRPSCRSMRDTSGFSSHHLLMMIVKYRTSTANVGVDSLTSEIGFKPYAALKQPQGPKDAEKQPQDSIVIDDEDEVVEVSNKTPNKNAQSSQNAKKTVQKNQQNRQKQQQQFRQQQQRQQQQRSGRDRNRNPFADDRSPQRNPFQDQRRSINPWEAQDNQEAMWNEQFQQQQQRYQDHPMSDNRFNRYDDGPFDMMDQEGRNINEFDQMMARQFGMFSMNQQNDNGFNNCGPMDSDDPPLDGRWGNQVRPQNFNRFSPPRQRSPFERVFSDDDELSFGRDSPGIPPNIPDDEIDEYIMRKQEAIKRRLEQLDKQLISSVENSRHRDFEHSQLRRKETVFSETGDVHYVPNPAAVARNRDRRSGGGRRGQRGSRNGVAGRTSRQNQRRERAEMHRKKDPFADVDIVPIIRISEDRSPSPKRNREDEFDPAQFDAAWS